jgi:starvation-inducible DNA-binding protein
MPSGLQVARPSAVTKGLGVVLADTFTLYLKTHAYHWNVTGPNFHSLHALFEQQYNELWQAVDEVAERIRALGQTVEASHASFAGLSKVGDPEAKEARKMIADLALGHEVAATTLRALWKDVEAAQDQPTLDLLTRRLEAHEKAMWMLRSHLE